MSIIKNIYGDKVGPGPSYHEARLALGISSSGLQITRSLYFYSGTNYGGTRFTSNWYKRGTYAALSADPSSFTLTTTVASLANISYGTTYTFGGGSVTDADTSTVYRCAAGYYSGKHISSPTAYSYTPYKLTFNVNGGSWGANVRLNNNNYTGSNYVIVALNDTYFNDMSSDIPTRTGYTFKGWYTATSGGTQIYNASGVKVAGTSYWNSSGQWIYKGNLTVYAQWQPNTYTITYDANGGTGGPGTQTKTYGVDLTISSTIPTREGYTFVEWNTSADGTGYGRQPGDTITGNESKIMYAIWQAQCTLTYWPECEDYLHTKLKYDAGTTVTLWTADVYDRTGYTLTSWNTKYDGSGTSYALGSSITLSSDLNLYAQWSIRSYLLTFDANGGTNPPVSGYVDYGATVAIPSTQPTRTGYSLLGWSESKTAATPSILLGTNYTMGASNKTLYAVWERTKIASYYTDASTRKSVIADVYDQSSGTWKAAEAYKYVNGSWKKLLV